MPCTTILVGKKASYDGSTMIARTDDGGFDVKKLIVTTPDKQARTYKTVESKLTLQLPDNPITYTSCPNVDPADGLWATQGFNEANVGMSATETTSTNALVLGADPYVVYQKAKNRKEKDIPGGIGEEDFIYIVLPYIRSAREGVLRLGALLEEYGTYESNGIAFNDENEVWWLETIGGHHWMARKLDDDQVAILPNRFDLDRFDFDDAYGAQKANLCCRDMKDFIEKNHLDLNKDENYNPRYGLGTHSDMDHVYNTPRAWFMGRYLCPTTIKWDGPDAQYTPECNDVPWSMVPEKKITVEDVKYMLSSYYQSTPYNPYAGNAEKKGIYRPISVANTGTMSILQVRPYVPQAIRCVQWICFGSTAFDAIFPVYTNVKKLPAYLSRVTLDPTTENFYWVSRIIGTIADAHYKTCIQPIKRYQMAVSARGHQLINQYDAAFAEKGSMALLEEANQKLCEMAKEESTKALRGLIAIAGESMTNRFKLSDN